MLSTVAMVSILFANHTQGIQSCLNHPASGKESLMQCVRLLLCFQRPSSGIDSSVCLVLLIPAQLNE